ncbi:hypothetical protein Q6D67_17870 [Haliea sp. E1-2-M8]|uniref:hypothetical protein n=1 Tax=Haliea sp. E1-2-M8 TaxID=3064706 RepID=UPI0027160A62|nr:hypothetical protein [Haliea sp. E1-2-M8]MDO8863570.1 hypothetical protein [Haliea sp. E1-2-M8]
MHEAASHLSDSVIIVPAIPSDVTESYNSDNTGKWYKFIEAHVDPLRTELRKQIPESMFDSVTEIYKKHTPISGSLVSLHWLNPDTKFVLSEVLRHQFGDTAIDRGFGETAPQYTQMKETFCAAIRLFWEHASWVALHLGTEYEMDFPLKQATDNYFNVVDPKLAKMMFDHAFSQMCVDDRTPHHAKLKDIYESEFCKTLDIEKLSGLDSYLAKLISGYVKTCADYWKLGGYKQYTW